MTPPTSLTTLEFLPDQQLVHPPDVSPKDRIRSSLQFDSVIFGRIVTAGDHRSGVSFQSVNRVIERRGRYGTELYDLQTGGEKSSAEEIRQER